MMNGMQRNLPGYFGLWIADFGLKIRFGASITCRIPEMARRLKTSLPQVARFLDPENCIVQLDTMQKAVAIPGKRLVIKLEDIPRSAVQ